MGLTAALPSQSATSIAASGPAAITIGEDAYYPATFGIRLYVADSLAPGHHSGKAQLAGTVSAHPRHGRASPCATLSVNCRIAGSARRVRPPHLPPRASAGCRIAAKGMPDGRQGRAGHRRIHGPVVGATHFDLIVGQDADQVIA
jgi:hypothetical protein